MLFPDIPVKKKTSSEKAEIERWRAIRKEAALKIDRETAEVDWHYAQTLDPYGVCDEWELPEEFHQVGRDISRVLPEVTFGLISAIFLRMHATGCGRSTVASSLSLQALRGCPTREIEDGEVPL